MDNTQLERIKANLLCELRSYLPKVREQLCGIDSRLWQYVTERTEALMHYTLPLDDDGAEVEDSIAGLYELLCMRKALRKLCTYPINIDYARRWLLAIEGVWEDDKWLRGGVKFDTPRGAQHVRLMPFQVWFIVTTMLFQHDVDMERSVVMLPSEFLGEDGKVYDRRRLCTEADLFITRKSGKTELGASMDFSQFTCMGESNEQVSIVANDANQAVKIAYKAIKAYAYQVDPSSTNKLGGKLFKVGATSMVFRENRPRTASITAFAAGGKPRDGFNSGWVHNDEAGQGRYINEHNDMESTVQELVGSGGTRRERMRLNTTTAGKVIDGPYREHIERLQEALLEEMSIPLGEAKELPYDNNNALILCLDPWDWTGNIDDLNHSHIFRRVNCAIGVTVQPSWYKERIQMAKSGTEDERKEVLTKDFNIWQSERIQKWIQGDEIRLLQTDRRIEHCTAADGWIVLTGMDFTNVGDDLQASTYLAIRKNPDTLRTEFFADLDAWMSEEALERSPLHTLLRQWSEEGWLHVVPGKVLSPQLPVDRIVSLRHQYGVNMAAFGYDKFNANEPVNLIKAWLVSSVGVKPKNIGNYVMPISQTFGSMTMVIDELTYLIRNENPYITFSPSPLWSWEFQNCQLIESTDGYENHKVVKISQERKVDNVQSLLNALACYDILNGKINK